jgi:hypothetical protein
MSGKVCYIPSDAGQFFDSTSPGRTHYKFHCRRWRHCRSRMCNRTETSRPSCDCSWTILRCRRFEGWCPTPIYIVAFSMCHWTDVAWRHSVASKCLESSLSLGPRARTSETIHNVKCYGGRDLFVCISISHSLYNWLYLQTKPASLLVPIGGKKRFCEWLEEISFFYMYVYSPALASH